VNAISCPICSSQIVAAFATAHDRLFGLAAGSFDLQGCNDCGCIFQRRMPTESELPAYYPQKYWWCESGKRDAAGMLARLEKAYRDFVIVDHVRFVQRCAAECNPTGRTLLDVGCGSGAFVAAAARCGFEAHGMDVSPQAAAVARRQSGVDVRQGDLSDDPWGGRKFDFVTMFHVLEHLPDPKRALTCVARWLAPGGALILQVPNAASVQARIFRERWYGLDVPRHVINFSPRGLSLLLAETGFAGSVCTRFSLRDNPAALASSVAPALDPIGRKGRGRNTNAFVEAVAEIGYFALTLLALGPTLLESAVGRGATIWACVQRRPCNP
jgi:2-polyprenyl-3-methyl-5-hydroxy-6-metoxy-1,4-benzoquinol methylase